MSDERATIANAGELNNIEITKQSTKPADDISAIASVPYLNRAWTQIILISVVCFGSAGMFNALSSIGGGLPGWAQSDIADSTAYVQWVFTACSIIAPSVLALIGVRNTVLLGSTGYLLYVLAIYNFVQHDQTFTHDSLHIIGQHKVHVGDQHDDDGSVPSQDSTIFLIASAYLGFCAALLWTGQGAIVMAYPTEDSKASAIAVFW
jgi:hypothetical protein